MATTLTCSVITPEAQIFDGPADFVVVPAHDGEIGILPGRAPLMAKLGAGLMRLTVPGGGKDVWFIAGGFVQVLENRVIVLTQRAMRPDQIDRGQAAQQLDAARAMPVHDDIALKRKAVAEATARAQLHVAGRA